MSSLQLLDVSRVSAVLNALYPMRICRVSNAVSAKPGIGLNLLAGLCSRANRMK